MNRRVIRLGDPHDHGGHVVSSAASHVKIAGIPVALMGDKCSCPRPGHTNCVIAEGDPNHRINGIPVAYDGHRTSCGGVLSATVPNVAKG